MSESETIAIFGATGNSGKEILASAIEKGYKVRIMVRDASKLSESMQNHPDVTIFKGDITSTNAIKDTVKGATYVISVVGGRQGKPEEFPTGDFVAFTQTLVEVMKETPTVKVFLHQAGAFVPHPDGSLPLIMKIMGTVIGRLAGIWPNLREHENIIKYMSSVQNDDDIKFKMIATRPGGLKFGESKKGIELVASDTDVPTTMVTYCDLGKFTVEAIKDESLYGRFPFVVEKSSGYTVSFGAIIAIAAIFAGYVILFKR